MSVSLAGRTIILSTHHMDEADILGDRIAIISHGRVCCCGSSLFLKKTYGRGYYLTIARANQDRVAGRVPTIRECDKNSIDEGICSDSISSLDPPDAADLSRLVRRHVPEAEFLEVVGQELVYVLPYAGATNGSFASLFKDLDLEKGALGVTSYGISDTSLEEIFLKVAEDTGVDVESHDTQRPMCENGKGSYTITGWSLIKQQFIALFIKRFHHARRSRRGIIAQVVMPAFFVCLALIFSLIVPPFVEYPSLELQPWIFDDPGVDQWIRPSVRSLRRGTGAWRTHLQTASAARRSAASYSQTAHSELAVYRHRSEREEADAPHQFLNESLVSMAMTERFHLGRFLWNGVCVISFTLIVNLTGETHAFIVTKTQNTTDTLQNLTARNMTDFLIKSYQKSGKIRYGGVSVGGVNSQVKLNESDITALIDDLKSVLNISQRARVWMADGILMLLSSVMDGCNANSGTLASSTPSHSDLESFWHLYCERERERECFNQTEPIFQAIQLFLLELGTRDNVKVWFYNQGWHSLVSFLNVASNSILRGNLPAGRRAEEFGITTFNHPLNLTKEQLSFAALATTSTDVVVSICVIFAMSFIPASFVLFLIQERVSKSKHLQFVSGVNPTIYWLANFAWDMCNYIVPCIIVIIIFLCFQQKSYVSPPNLPALILLLALYGWSITPMMYPASFLFSIPSTAYVVLTCINLFIGINGSVATFVMELFDDPNITRINDVIKQVLLVFPHFCLGRGLMDMAKNQAMATLYQNLGKTFTYTQGNIWRSERKADGCLSLQVKTALKILSTGTWSVKSLPTSSDEEDEDVARERERCFGLLGINGAGKTTTFKMLTGDISPTAGDAFVNGYSIRTEMQLVQQNMGYCPQFDAINDLLTGREHLEFYARLRGVPEKEVSMVAEWGIQKLGLVKYSEKSAGTYSGGNKRKLSTAMALIGCPPLIFLVKGFHELHNESHLNAAGSRSCSLGMEECEALCTRMAIMVNGHFKCLGSIQHLKSR
ncbi:Phospholipid-transporting ATPase ABCA1 [Labeo rohita]|uniref:Phospholipid-transporting ATPase ABCA1 n=1 Tax=Labeo rohita TaxID=84645 RepID=A0ABQ8MIX1_LABRO|nr:Phospholipid-transporting ATPase ABCA1 [Labeo rohita]